MAKVYDVPADVLIERLANILRMKIFLLLLGLHLSKLEHMQINLHKTVNGGKLDVHQF